MATRIRDKKTDQYRKLARVLADQALHQIKVGIHAEDAAYTYPNGMTLGEVAEIHEFGLAEPRVPRRSAIVGWFDENLPSARWKLMREMRLVAKGQQPYAEALKIFAEWAARRIRDRIDDRTAFAPNAPSTIEKKGFDYPLVESGVLRHSIKGTVDE